MINENKENVGIYQGIEIDISKASPLDIANEIIKILDSKKARGIKLLKVRERTVIADYFVLCTGTSSTQIRSLANEVDFYFSQAGMPPLHKDGSDDGSCIVTNLFAWDSAPDWMMEGVKDADEVHCLKNFFPEANEVRKDGDEPFTGLDPWSRPYRYFHDPDTAPDSYRVFSLGPNDPNGEHPDRWIFLER